MQQRISNPKLKWWQGMLLIVGIVVMLMVFQFIASVVSYMVTGDMYDNGIASLAFWIFGGFIALQLVRRFIMDYLYIVEGITFRVCRIYANGKPREALQIVTRSILAVGTPEEIEGKYPGSHPSVYTRSRADIEVCAVAYGDEGKVRVIHIQPDEKMKQKLIDSIETKKK